MLRLRARLVDAFRRLDTCKVANAIETFDVRLRNEGFADSTIRAVFDDLPPVLGHAVTARIRSSVPPPVGGNSYHDRTDWWQYILTVPAPRIVVVEDTDGRPGVGAFIGEVHANILKALGCVGYATNGAVRDLPRVRGLGFQLFAPHVSVTHSYVHIVDFGEPVQLGGLAVASGDILYGDGHGLLTLPEEIVERVPEAVERMAAIERQIIALCQSSDFSLDRLGVLVRERE
jgi:4-hydroxy-4-methyl-2-oxoglutarate aldolase